MDTLLKDLVFLEMFMAIWLTTVSSNKQDVCFWNTFNATCAENEVIQMEHAYYGRMSVGSCIPESAATMMGCKENVLSYFDYICSGRHSCQLELPDKNLAAFHKPCPPGLESYLQLEYNCMKVHFSAIPCTSQPLHILGKTQGLLANAITELNDQGSPECPWMVRGSPGQKIRLTLHDYGTLNTRKSQGGGLGGRDPQSRPPEGSDICHVYAKVKEDGTENVIPLCADGNKKKIVYLSETEGVQITLNKPKHTQRSSYFLLRFEIIGCPNYIAPEGSVIKRRGNNVTVNCPDTGRKWTVSCEGTSWTSEGKVTDCIVSGQKPISLGALFQSAQTMPQWILIVVIIAAAAIIAVPIVVIGIISFRRRQDTMPESVRIPETQTNKSMKYKMRSAKEHEPMLSENDRSQYSHRGRVYTNTVKRNMAVHPGLQGGGFPPLPLPPTESVANAQNSTLHGTSSRTRSSSAPFYHELDPEHINCHTNTPRQCTAGATETADMDLPSSPSEVLLSASLGVEQFEQVET